MFDHRPPALRFWQPVPPSSNHLLNQAVLLVCRQMYHQLRSNFLSTIYSVLKVVLLVLISSTELSFSLQPSYYSAGEHQQAFQLSSFPVIRWLTVSLKLKKVSRKLAAGLLSYSVSRLAADGHFPSRWVSNYQLQAFCRSTCRAVLLEMRLVIG